MLRSSALKRSAMKAYRPVRSPEEKHTRALVAQRSGGLCEMRLARCTAVATDMSHRIGRKMGGRPQHTDWRASNVVAACRTCHQWCHRNPAEAVDLGLMLKEGDDTELYPMDYQGVAWVRLGDDGGLWPVTP